MTTYAMPTSIPPTQAEWGQASNTWAWLSPLSGHIQTNEMPAPRWRLSYSWLQLPVEYSAELEAFMTKLHGKGNRFSAFNVSRPNPRGSFRGSPTVASTIAKGGTSGIIAGGGGQAGKTLLIGDFISINSELKMVVADATADGSGNITVSFEPPMRVAAPTSAPVIWDKPSAVFILDEDAVKWGYANTILTSLVLVGTEMW